MSQQYDKPSGTLFINKYKEKENHPDMRGSLELLPEVVHDLVAQMQRGERFPKLELSAWSKHTDKAGKFLSVSGKKLYVKEEKSAPAPSPVGQQFTPAPPADDKIPF
jgi:hypothetical protein